MLFTATQTRNFFEDANQMAVPCATTTQLANEGITDIEDLSEIDKESLKQIA